MLPMRPLRLIEPTPGKFSRSGWGRPHRLCRPSARALFGRDVVGASFDVLVRRPPPAGDETRRHRGGPPKRTMWRVTSNAEELRRDAAPEAARETPVGGWPRALSTSTTSRRSTRDHHASRPATEASARSRSVIEPTSNRSSGWSSRATSTIAGERSMPKASMPSSRRWAVTCPGPQPASATGPPPAVDNAREQRQCRSQVRLCDQGVA